jgi:superfamily II DNA/RNA helicase
MQAMLERSYTNPRDIQRRALKYIIGGRDIFVPVPGFAEQIDTMIIGTLQDIDTSIHEVQAPLLISTREVADRIQLCGNSLGKFISLKLHACIASPCPPKFTEGLETPRAGVHGVTGTPGSVQDTIRRRALKPDKIIMVVLHRANDIFSYQLGNQLFNLLECLPQSIRAVTLCEGDIDEENLHKLLTRMYNPIRLVLNAKRIPKG